MHSSENDIDQLLAGLRETEPATGMEQRVLAAMEQVQEKAAPRRVWLWPALVAGACAAGSVVYVAASRPKQVVVNAPVVAQVPVAPMPTRVERMVEVRSAKKVAVFAPAVAPVPTADEIAAEETAAPTQVAPPLPLTAGERMLMRATRRSEGVMVAELERPSRDAAVAQFVHRNLASIAFAEVFHPTAPVEVAEPVEHPQE